MYWPAPTSVKTLQSFLGFALFYWRFIKNYSKTISNLTSLTRKDIPFVLTDQDLLEFNALKKSFTTAPILWHFDSGLCTIVKTEASKYAISGFLLQFFKVNLTSLRNLEAFETLKKLDKTFKTSKHPVTFDSWKLVAAELNYEIHNKALLAIVFCLRKLRSFLLSASAPFEVLTDHDALKHFLTTKVLTRYQVHWDEFWRNLTFSLLTALESFQPCQMLWQVGTTFAQPRGSPLQIRIPVMFDNSSTNQIMDQFLFFSINNPVLGKKLNTLLKSQKKDSPGSLIIQDLQSGVPSKG